MRPARLLPVLAFLLCAGVAHADTQGSAPAGFAPSLWLSQSSIQDGETVKVYTAVYDATPDAIQGTVVFMVDGASITSKPFNLAAGANSVLSADWKATAGKHALSARIDSPTGGSSKQPVQVADTAADVSVTVADPPPPSKASAAAHTAATAASSAASTAGPVIASAGQTILNATEAVRQAGVDYFASQLADDAASSTATTSVASGAVLGTTTYRAPAATTTAKNGFMQSVDRAFLMLFSSPALFYLALIVLLLLFFWFIKRRFSSDRA